MTPDKQTATTLRDLAYALNGMADAMENGDSILGAISGMGVANHLPALPAHVRELFTEYLTDEAAAGAKADRLYMEAQA